MRQNGPSDPFTALEVLPDAAAPAIRTGAGGIVLSRSRGKRRSVSSVVSITAEDVALIVAAAEGERNQLLIRTAWVTGGRISEVLALCALGVEAEALFIPNLKNPAQPFKRVFLPAERDLPGRLLLWQKATAIADQEPLFRSRKGGRLDRRQAWRIIREASERAGVYVRAMRPSTYGPVGTLVPIWPHVLRHSRAMQILRHSKDLELVKEQLGHANLKTTSRYLKYSDDERGRLMGLVPE